MPVGYDFDRDTTEPSADGRSRLRLVLLFLGIAAVAGGLLWFVIPHGNSEDAGATLPVEVPPKDASREIAAAAAGAAAEVDRAASSSAAAPDSTAEIDQAAESSGAEPETAPDAETIPTAEPEKGREWVGDIPAEQDVPAVKPGATSAKQQEELERLRGVVSGGGSPDDIAAAEQLVAALPENSAGYREAGKILAELNRRNLFESSDAGGDVVIHRVVPGNSLSRLAQHYHATVEGIRAASKLKNDVLQVGRRVRVMPGPWKIVIEKSARLLKLYRKSEGAWKLWGVYEVGVGRLDRTPAADFVISTRLRHPAWYAPGGVVYKYGEEGNVLGDYFLKLAASGTPDRPLVGYGIHGTVNESDVNRSISNGCIRMRNREVEVIYLLVPGGTPVEIRN